MNKILAGGGGGVKESGMLSAWNSMGQYKMENYRIYSGGKWKFIVCVGGGEEAGRNTMNYMKQNTKTDCTMRWNWRANAIRCHYHRHHHKLGTGGQ